MQLPPHATQLRLSARALPEVPGVYFWKDAKGRVLYIGKAVNLRARVGSYFGRALHDRRTHELLTRARDLSYEVTPTELDALFRESHLIKQVQPPYNRALRRPRASFYLKLDGDRRDPHLEVVRGETDDHSMYFGPFRSGPVAREMLRFVHDVLPLRKCARANPRCRPCLYYQMSTCAAPALDDEHRRRHLEAIEQLHNLLDGRADRVTAWLEGKRDRMSEHLFFERAAEVQERLEALREMLGRQTILNAAVQCRCVLIRADDPKDETSRLLLVAHGRVLSVREGTGATAESVTIWLRAHTPLMQAVDDEAAELDAASVLERWIVVNRTRIRWVAIPHGASEADLVERVAYVLGE